ncbi:MAG TPA: diguanylate cyclase [Candidatus Limnocylindria bacterium]|jgi:diguanylate cyclase (GGDEF)-like protein|nr:diguanylate cyclase [Candidatus Limnocylindria bacterium]
MPSPRQPSAGPVRSRRPALLALVFGIFLVLIGLTATALVVVTAMHLSSATLNAVVSRDRSLVELFVNGNVTAADIDQNGPSRASAEALEAKLGTLTAEDEILRIDLRGLDGAILASSDPELRGTNPGASTALQSAIAGEPSISLLDAVAATDAGDTVLDTSQVVQEYLPLLSDEGEPLAVVAVWRDAAPLLSGVDAARRDIVIVTLAAAILLGVVLLGVFWAAQKRILRQQADLVEAERRDPLTNLLNHGAVVTLMAEAVETARAKGRRFGLALVDIDNFRLFNDTHGHDAADQVLLRVADWLQREDGEDKAIARYGPDEFLLVLPGADRVDMEAAVNRIRTGLSGVSVQFGESEQLPVTVSAGICLYPDHADSVTELLSAVTVAVGEAKASGGDAVCVAQLGDERQKAVSGSFDVLQGLVIAVDSKDRYTKRHSEDVARYAVFLAGQLGLDQDLRRTIHLAGLLHDVGKIGIPDHLLRKPSKLTAEEFDVFKQHVALGDAIVRDIPNVDLVRAGIRHHHERWDGNGYLEGLEAGEIPIIARVLAVADAFSAMTTTRPYRKALSVEEALKRLGDAAGRQLEEDLVVAFIKGMETAPDAPIPAERPSGIWRPTEWVA